MQVGAISTPGGSDWRWRIVNYAGETVEESPRARTFSTIAQAVQDGTRRLRQMDVDRSTPRGSYRSTSHLRLGRGGRA
jgi:hypothetical protein